MASGSAAFPLSVDVSNPKSVDDACEQVIAKHGAPWGLVNNAGFQDRFLLFDPSVADWDRMHDVNARGPFLMTRAIARAMVESQRGGHIVNVASAALIGSLTNGHAAYASSKAALLGLMRATALELAVYAITVNTVLPGGVMTPGAIASKGPVPARPALRPPPLGISDAEDIGEAVDFLMSNGARKITNQRFAINGGWSIT
jgi:NAD(P)-dependent dehydrogenase (short-subunit alcohol dehydrogenase family)